MLSFLAVVGLSFSNMRMHLPFIEELSNLFGTLVVTEILHWERASKEGKKKIRIQKFLASDRITKEDDEKLHFKLEKYHHRLGRHNTLNRLYNACTSAQARLLDVRQDTEFLFKLAEKIVIEDIREAKFLPYVRGIAQKVITEKTLSHRAGYNQIAKGFSTAHYMEEFSTVLDKILKQWEGAQVRFSFSDYQNGLATGLYRPPTTYRPFMRINRSQYRALEKEKVHANNKKNKTYNAFWKIRQRVGSEYYTKICPLQIQTLDYSQMSFPAYRFILPEVLADDWLAIVDWHKFQRDHVVHQPLTAYIVLKLLTGGGDSSQALHIDNVSFLDLCVDEILKWDATSYLKEYLLNTRVAKSEIWLDGSTIGRLFWKHLFVEAAYLAAIFHDMGYPWQYVNILSNKLENVGYQSDTVRKINRNIWETFIILSL